MEHENRFWELRHVNHTKCTAPIANANFPDTGSHRSHRLPIVRVTAALEAVDLIPRRTSRREWKGPEIGQGAATEFHRLRTGDHSVYIYYFIYSGKWGIPLTPPAGR